MICIIRFSTATWKGEDLCFCVFFYMALDPITEGKWSGKVGCMFGGTFLSVGGVHVRKRETVGGYCGGGLTLLL